VNPVLAPRTKPFPGQELGVDIRLVDLVLLCPAGFHRLDAYAELADMQRLVTQLRHAFRQRGTAVLSVVVVILELVDTRRVRQFTMRFFPVLVRFRRSYASLPVEHAIARRILPRTPVCQLTVESWHGRAKLVAVESDPGERSEKMRSIWDQSLQR